MKLREEVGAARGGKRELQPCVPFMGRALRASNSLETRFSSGSGVPACWVVRGGVVSRLVPSLHSLYFLWYWVYMYWVPDRTPAH